MHFPVLTGVAADCDNAMRQGGITTMPENGWLTEPSGSRVNETPGETR
jgi:hypothetical protein